MASYHCYVLKKNVLQELTDLPFILIISRIRKYTQRRQCPILNLVKTKTGHRKYTKEIITGFYPTITLFADLVLSFYYFPYDYKMLHIRHVSLSKHSLLLEKLNKTP